MFDINSMGNDCATADDGYNFGMAWVMCIFGLGEKKEMLETKA